MSTDSVGTVSSGTRKGLVDHDPTPFRAALAKVRRDGERSWIAAAPTGSMSPLVGSRAELLLEWGAAIEAGDVIVFTSHLRSLVVHRAIRISEELILEAADRGPLTALGAVQWIPRTAVIGRVVAIRRGDLVVDLDTTVAKTLARAHTLLVRSLTTIGHLDEFPASVSRFRKPLFASIALFDTLMIHLMARLLFAVGSRHGTPALDA